MSRLKRISSQWAYESTSLSAQSYRLLIVFEAGAIHSVNIATISRPVHGVSLSPITRYKPKIYGRVKISQENTRSISKKEKTNNVNISDVFQTNSIVYFGIEFDIIYVKLYVLLKCHTFGPIAAIQSLTAEWSHSSISGVCFMQK